MTERGQDPGPDAHPNGGDPPTGAHPIERWGDPEYKGFRYTYEQRYPRRTPAPPPAVPPSPYPPESYFPRETKAAGRLLVAFGVSGAAAAVSPDWVITAGAVLTDRYVLHRYVIPAGKAVAALPRRVGTWRESRRPHTYTEPRPPIEPVSSQEPQQQNGSERIKKSAPFLFSLGAGVALAKAAPHWVNVGEDVIAGAVMLFKAPQLAREGMRNVRRFVRSTRENRKQG